MRCLRKHGVPGARGRFRDSPDFPRDFPDDYGEGTEPQNRGSGEERGLPHHEGGRPRQGESGSHHGRGGPEDRRVRWVVPRFAYVAIDDAGRRVKGTLISPSEEVLKKSLSEMGLYLLSTRVVKERKPLLVGKPKIRRRDIINFTIHLRTLISAGVPLSQGLTDLVEQTENRHLKEVLEDVQRNIQAGASFSDALGLHADVFSDTYVNIVRAGEATGRLDQVLGDLVRFLEWNEELASQIRHATIYPSIVLTAVVGLTILLFTFVFPRFIVIFEAAKVDLPLPTKIVIWVSTFFKENILTILVALLFSWAAFFLYGRTERGRLVIDRTKLRLPVVGDLMRKIEASRFCHYLGLLLRSGVDTSQSLWVVERVIKNRFVSSLVHQTREEVTAGGTLSDSLRKAGVFPPVVIRMVAAGESSGSLDETLEKVSEYFDREVPLAVRRTFAILEPLVILFLAVVVLGAALSMFLALYKMVGALSVGR
ncbi:MAG: type II secretion system F family protein [Deltaproteobacteria bacterium]|nr:MAG: type II secretion system F family protein [Deltaproteobacteria bacterium]